MNRNRIVVLSLAAIAVIVLAILLLPKRGGDAGGAGGQRAGSAGGAGGAGGQRLENGERRALTPEEAPHHVGELAAKNMEETRDQYVEFAKYPEWSRPAEPQYQELYQWNTVGPDHGQAVGFQGEQEIICHHALDKHFIEPGRPMTVIAQCYVEKEGTKTPVPFEATVEVQVGLTEAELKDEPADTSYFMKTYKAVGTPTPMRKATGDPSKRTATIAVESFAKPGEVLSEGRLITYFEPEGNELRPLELLFQYSAKPPVKILGKSSDEIVDGSLQVTLEVDVGIKAPIRFRAALAQQGHRDRPIAIFDKHHRPTKTGVQQVELTFFGRILREAELDGPYEVYSLHGSAYIEGAQVADIYWQEDRAFTTKAYKAEDFAPDEWQSEEKDAVLKNYAKTIEDLRKNVPAR